MIVTKEEFPINKVGSKKGRANLVELCRQILSVEMNDEGEYDVNRVKTLLRARIAKYPSDQRAEINNGCVKNAATDIRKERGLIHLKTRKDYHGVLVPKVDDISTPHDSNGKATDAKVAASTEEATYTIEEIDFAVRTSEGLTHFGDGAGDVLRLISRLTRTKGERT